MMSLLCRAPCGNIGFPQAGSATKIIEPTGGSRFCPSALVSQWRLPPVGSMLAVRRFEHILKDKHAE
jgi:hypothetical protein